MTTLNKDLAAVQLSQVIEVITDMDNDDTISIYNDYANCNGYELIFNNDEYTINDLFSSPYDAIRQTNNKDYKDHENYFTFNGYGHAVSFDYRLSDNSPIDISELAQWLISEDKLSEYHITVTTLEDMLASIEDNITDDNSVLYRMCDCLTIEYDDSSDIEDLIKDCMIEVGSYSYNKLKGLIEYLNINYQ